MRAALEQAVSDHQAGHLAQARRAFEVLARQGVAAAAYNLGVMHIEAELPDASVAEARRWFERAAAGGFVSAQVALGQLYETGRLGAVDLVQAHRWYEQAAAGGSVEAQVAAGTAYYLGRGAPKSAADAVRWYREAARSTCWRRCTNRATASSATCAWRATGTASRPRTATWRRRARSRNWMRGCHREVLRGCAAEP
jgi:TPR repeat protein